MNELLKAGKFLAVVLKGRVEGNSFRVAVTSRDYDIVLRYLLEPIGTRIFIEKKALAFVRETLLNDPFRDLRTVERFYDVASRLIEGHLVWIDSYYLFRHQLNNDLTWLCEMIFLETEDLLNATEIIRIIMRFL